MPKACFQHDVQSAEAFFALLKRGVFGSFHSVSEAHLQRYVDEFTFRWNNRVALGVDDAERAGRTVTALSGKRLTYRRPDEARTLKRKAKRLWRKRRHRRTNHEK
jgi:hypothetical protein